MTWSYSGDPSLDPKDAIRFIIGDTDQAERLLEDEEIRWAISNCKDNLNYAAYKCVLACIAKLSAGAIDLRIGNIEEKNSSRVKFLHEVADKLKGDIYFVPNIYCGGLSVDEKLDKQADEDATQSAFRRRDLSKGSYSIMDDYYNDYYHPDIYLS